MQARHLALKVLYQINEEDAYANIALDKAFSKIQLADSRDRGLVTELVYGCVKYKGFLDWVINEFAKPKIDKMAPWIRNIIRLGLYQIMFLDKVPVSAAINESVKLAKIYGHQGTVKFVNGVLRNIARNKRNLRYPNLEQKPVEHISIIYSFPQWLVERWIKDFGVKNTLQLCQYFNQPSPVWIRTNTLQINRLHLKQKLQEQDIKTIESTKTPEGLKLLNNVEIGKIKEFEAGFFTIQDESSMLVSHVLAPEAGQLILDVCSGPGGKTSHLAQLMKNTGQILAFDVHEHRLQLIKETCSRLGITNVKTELKDARFLTEFVEEQVDAVLVDAPCSGFGVLGRRPDARWRKKPEDIKDLQKIQQEILQEVSQLVKPGGTLVYSTCTITSEENNDVIIDFLNKNKDFYLDQNLPKYLPYETVEGSKGWIQFMPYTHNMDGFFIARLKRF
ncbi:MAG: rRNA (cytosine967-C5)-methyltransferase [Clostridia bacterium]|jgi:16S rRNA (cytosine967-C5)-methyltransferase|nr:rRNA (cytosine967-C5)-methyltransferase [Clostridia bacterium]MDN5322251.1 rRNA (cytosine967-C5)-methyltransferase [Clostridia bacterium]